MSSFGRLRHKIWQSLIADCPFFWALGSGLQSLKARNCTWFLEISACQVKFLLGFYIKQTNLIRGHSKVCTLKMCRFLTPPCTLLYAFSYPLRQVYVLFYFTTPSLSNVKFCRGKKEYKFQGPLSLQNYTKFCHEGLRNIYIINWSRRVYLPAYRCFNMKGWEPI